MKRIHFAADGMVDNVSRIGDETPVELGTIDVADDVMVGPGMIRDGDGFAWPIVVATEADVDVALAAAFRRGFAPEHPSFVDERLQVRDVEDRTNWLTSQASYAAAVAGGLGEVVDAEFRTASNATITVSYADGLAVLLGMAAWGRSLMQRSWALKDAIGRGEAPDVTTGWPQ